MGFYCVVDGGNRVEVLCIY